VIIPYFSLLMMLACAIAFHRMAKAEGHSELLWPALSILVWIITPGGLLMKVLGQVGLFFGIAIVRAAWEEYQSRRKP
jgi:hypothetical protein